MPATKAVILTVSGHEAYPIRIPLCSKHEREWYVWDAPKYDKDEVTIRTEDWT